MGGARRNDLLHVILCSVFVATQLQTMDGQRSRVWLVAFLLCWWRAAGEFCPCMNGGECSNDGCVCPEGYGGDMCQG